MSETVSVTHGDDAATRAEAARRGVEQAETGETTGADQVEHLREADPAGVDAVEQEASDGPEGRGLAR